MINLAGLPPLTGFYIKLGVLQSTSIALVVFLLSFSVSLLFAYMRLFLITPHKEGLKLYIVVPCCLGVLF